MRLQLLIFFNTFYIFFEVQSFYLQSSNHELPFNDKQGICITIGCNDTASWILERMDEDIDPCDNFYEFACGKFLNNTIIPNETSRVTSYTIIQDKLLQQLKSELEDRDNTNVSKPFRLAKDFYRSCMNETMINELGLKPLYQILEKLGGWPVVLGTKWNENDFHWTSTIYKFRKIGLPFNYFTDFMVSDDLKNHTQRILYLGQPSLSIQPMDHLDISMAEVMQSKIVKAYHSFMIDVAETLGAEKNTASKELQESLEFEIKLANISVSDEKLRNFTTMYNVITIKNLGQMYSSIPWLEYINTILSLSSNVTENDSVVILVPSFISELEKLLKETPKRVQANYIMWKGIQNSLKHLNKIREKEQAYHKAYRGYTKNEPRWKECVDRTSNYFSLSISAMYAKKYFTKNSKENVIKLVNNIKKEFKKILKSVDWLDKNTRAATLEKIDSMKEFVAYPEELLNDTNINSYYDKLEMNPEYYFESLLNISLFQTGQSLSKLKEIVNKSAWISHSDTADVNAFYRLDENIITIPAAILQGIVFNNDRPQYVNYGAIGSTIGHEITHGFDDQGSQFDKDGSLVDWWEASTKEKYLNLTECIINQYANYTVPEIGQKLNGIITQGENIADNGGLKVAYLAYNRWARRRKPEPKLLGLEKYNSQQMFWISAATAECQKYRPHTLKLLVWTDSHSPGEFRINGPVSNLPQFAKDFSCKPDSKMNPKTKCNVW